MELTVANDFQNNLDQVTIVSTFSHLAGTLNEIEYLHSRDKNMETLEKNPIEYNGKLPSVKCLKATMLMKEYDKKACR